ncbi:pentatricopeptide repeat-containing protein At3g53170 [Cannabis sativa]|uniref:pentatricopeptide repeat-containing protein At3g53170 n=1 Tax=Cannabis sativa TaxID=3483 RepID=UPI0029CA99AE|nr:pentatricopeptide repeat-containing protein At3g53170 [Cannabis sativa]
MESYLLDTCSWRYSLTSTTYSTKFRNDSSHIPIPQIRCLHVLSKRSSSSSREMHKNSDKDLSRILRTDAAIKNIERKANSKKYNKLWPKAVLEALDEAISNNFWETALKIFGLLRMQHWYEPRCQTYTKLLVMLGRCKQPQQASLLFEIMSSDGLQPTLAVYTALVGAYGQSGLLDEAFSAVADMKSVSDCVPDVYTYTILINCCIKHHRLDLIQRVLDEMSYFGIECSTVTYNTLIHGYGKVEMFEQMESTLTDMIESGNTLPDVFTLNSILGAYGNYGQISKMEKWYDEFQLMGIRPDVKTFNILIKSYGKAGMYDKMSSVIEYMDKRFFSPNVVTFNIVIDVFGKAGDVSMMDDYFKQMKHRGLKPNSITYCSLVNAYSKAGLIEKVDSIFMQVANSDATLDTPFFNCVINAYGQVGDVNMIHELLLAMKERNCYPDNITYATVIQIYKAQGMNDAAQAMESKMINPKEHSDNLKGLIC